MDTFRKGTSVTSIQETGSHFTDSNATGSNKTGQFADETNEPIVANDLWRDDQAVVHFTRRETASVSSSTVSDTHNPFARGFWDPAVPLVPMNYSAQKRVFDIVLAALILLLASPVLLIAALLVKLTSRGPIIFKQVRVGQGGRHFWCYKFRSMCADAESKKAELLALNEASGPVFKIKNDPRVTPVGRILRKFSIDELPQLFNVLKGDMSLVGPRPPLPSEVDSYPDYLKQRLAVVPGLTCLWQIMGRSSISFERWMELDLLYIEQMSFRNDVIILLKTIPAVLTGSGAH